MKTETQLEAQMNSFTSELRANEARKDPYVQLKIEIHDIVRLIGLKMYRNGTFHVTLNTI